MSFVRTGPHQHCRCAGATATHRNRQAARGPPGVVGSRVKKDSPARIRQQTGDDEKESRRRTKLHEDRRRKWLMTMMCSFFPLLPGH